jgi:Rne/Rng family ribonuclease
LVAIDINTGKYVGKSNRLEDTITRTNVDAVHEIVRQIRLRNLGGIIVVDFIDLERAEESPESDGSSRRSNTIGIACRRKSCNS